jgi:hypothetical protein
MKHRLLPLLLAAASAADLPPRPAEAAELAHAREARRQSGSIAYIRSDGAWEGYWPHGNDEYVEYTVSGKAELNDGFHILLKPGLGLMLTFADRRNFVPGPNLLEAHKQWELAYWRQKADHVEARDRSDLAGGRSDIKITELNLTQAGEPMRAYLIGAAAPDGVFAFAVSPVSAKDDALVRRIVDSIRVVNHPLDIAAVAARIRGKGPAAPPLQQRH